jgi:hypothetical protein
VADESLEVVWSSLLCFVVPHLYHVIISSGKEVS